MPKFIRLIMAGLPIRLTILQFRNMFGLLFFWYLLFHFSVLGLGQSFGIPPLFFEPVYFDKVSFLSYAFVGSGMGFFTMSYNLAAFVVLSNRIRFLANHPKPVLVFVLNNAILPIVFFTLYMVKQVSFCAVEGLNWQIAVGGFSVGWLSVTFIVLLYLYFSNSLIINFFSQNINSRYRGIKLYRRNILRSLNQKSSNSDSDRIWFFDVNLRFSNTTQLGVFPNRSVLFKLLNALNVNALLLNLLVIGLIFTLGKFSEWPVFQFPAATTLLLGLSLAVLLVGGLIWWIGRWSWALLAFGYLAINLLFKNGYFAREYQAFGIDYTNVSDTIKYNYSTLKTITADSITQADKMVVAQALTNRLNILPSQNNKKPTAIFVCASGGGLRATLWSYRVLQTLNQQTNGLTDSCITAISGASGGMLGAMYYRELIYRGLQPTDSLYSLLGNSLLSGLIFNMVVIDAQPFRRKVNIGHLTYKSDRGLAFERQLNHNTAQYLLNRKMSHYYQPELDGRIPLSLMYATVANDGRKLYLGALPFSFLGRPSVFGANNSIITRINGFDFRKIMANANPDSLLFTSALRMNASFPYITPMVNLPTLPPIKVIDAGLTDNYGIAETSKLIWNFRELLKDKTQKVIILIIRDSGREAMATAYQRPHLLRYILNPIGAIFDNLNIQQDHDNDSYLKMLAEDFGNKLKIIEFAYTPVELETANGKHRTVYAALNWQLTNTEKSSINLALNLQHNQNALNGLINELYASNNKSNGKK